MLPIMTFLYKAKGVPMLKKWQVSQWESKSKL